MELFHMELIEIYSIYIKCTKLKWQNAHLFPTKVGPNLLTIESAQRAICIRRQWGPSFKSVLTSQWSLCKAAASFPILLCVRARQLRQEVMVTERVCVCVGWGYRSHFLYLISVLTVASLLSSDKKMGF